MEGGREVGWGMEGRREVKETWIGGSKTRNEERDGERKGEWEREL